MDEDYCRLLFADPIRALAGYDLTKDERTALSSIDAETLDGFAEQLGPHLARKQ